MSSAKSLIEEWIFSTISLMYIKKSRGPSIEPWGTPAFMEVQPYVFIPVFQATFIYMFISGWSQGIELSPLLTLYKN